MFLGVRFCPEYAASFHESSGKAAASSRAQRAVRGSCFHARVRPAKIESTTRGTSGRAARSSTRSGRATSGKASGGGPSGSICSDTCDTCCADGCPTNTSAADGNRRTRRDTSGDSCRGCSTARAAQACRHPCL